MSDLNQKKINIQNTVFYENDLDRWVQCREAPLNLSGKTMLYEFLDACPEGKILDMGSGAGMFLKVFVEIKKDVLGIEMVPLYSKETSSRASSRAARACRGP